MGHKQFDHIVIGSGPGGSLAASRLVTETGARVLLLEAGPRDKGVLFRIPAGFLKYYVTNRFYWPYAGEPEPQLAGRAPRLQNGKVLGGGSSVNAMVHVRGNRCDFDLWEEMTGDAAWGAEAAWRTYAALEANEVLGAPHHGVTGPLHVSNPRYTDVLSRAFVAAAQGAGHAFNADFNGERQAGVGFYQLNTRDARRWSAVDAFLRPLAADGRLTLRTGVEVQRILVEKGRAVGVVYMRDGELHEVRSEGDIILSAGAIASPKLLMLSGIGPADHLRANGIPVLHDLPGVGANFMDHVEAPVAAFTREPLGYYKTDSGWRSWLAGLRYLLFRDGPASSNGVEAGGFIRSDGTAAEPDLQLFAVPGIYLDKDTPNPPKGYGITLNACLLRPKSRGRIELRSANPADTPRIFTSFLKDPEDMETMLRGLGLVREILRQEPLASMLRAEALPGADVTGREAMIRHIGSFAKTVYHPMGTCRMGRAGDPMAVVDTDLRLRGIDGLRIVDASVMPGPISGNTASATYLVADTAMRKMLGQSVRSEQVAA